MNLQISELLMLWYGSGEENSVTIVYNMVHQCVVIYLMLFIL